MSEVKATKYEIITESVNKGDQYSLFTRLFKMGDKKLKIEIKSDAYDCQCYANIQIFNRESLQWNNLHSIHYSAMATPPKLVYRSPTVDSFKIDTDLLTKYAEDILN
jgi:hypothetical protein